MAKELQGKISPKFDEALLLDILKNSVDGDCDEVTVDGVDFGAAQKKGDAYLSTVTRFTVNFTYKNGNKKKKSSLPLIAKSLPTNIARRKTFRSVDFFKTEVAFYTIAWPALDAFQKSKNVKEPFVNIPKCLASCADGTNDFIVMEDLSHDGFGNRGRSDGLDVQHVKLIIELFAKFHSLGFAFKDQKPEEFKKISDSLEETYFHEKFRKWYINMQSLFKDIVADAVEKELPAEYSVKLKKLFDNDFYTAICKSCAERGPLAVISQGDAWLPNFLLHYDEKKNPDKAIMIDFQLARCSSLVLDIVFFLYACTDGEFLENHFDEIISHYHTVFAANLKALGTKEELVTLKLIKEEMKKHGAFFVGMITEAIIMSLLEDDEVTDIDEIQGTEAVPLETVWTVKPLKTQEKRKHVAGFIKHAADSEFF